MPITIFPPVDNLFVGPGTEIRAATDFIGPFPTGSYWQLEITTRTGERLIAQGTNEQAVNNTVLSPVLFQHLNGTTSVQWPVPLPAAAAPVQQATATIRLIQAPSTILEQTSTPVQWFPDPAAVAYVNSLAMQAGTGGFAPSDRTTLNGILGAVQLVLPPTLTGGPSVLMQVIDLVRGPPRSVLRPFGQQLISGRGSLSAQPPGSLLSYGGTWSIATIPAGYGQDDGVVVEYHRRIGQFEVIREGGAAQKYIDVLEDSHRGNDYILWQFPNPSEIKYDIAPGVVLLWEWLL